MGELLTLNSEPVENDCRRSRSGLLGPETALSEVTSGSSAVTAELLRRLALSSVCEDIGLPIELEPTF